MNSSLVALKTATTASYRLCIAQSTKALELHADPIAENDILPMTKCLTPAELGKTLYRRGAAKAALNDLDEAINDFKQALEHVKGDKTIEAEMNKVKAKRDEKKKKQQKAYAKMFG